MTDSFGREINYLRVSVTQRCNLNCVYCGSETPAPDALSAEQIITLVSAFAECGFTKVRLTGGEPLMREDICEIARGISRIDGIKKLTLTTNGVLLKKYAEQLKSAGVNAVNVSIDALDGDVYKKLTGRDRLNDVLEGIEAARNAGISIRTNSVLIRGENESEAQKLISLAEDSDTDVRFIELMPFSDMAKNKDLIVTGAELLKKFSFLRPVSGGAQSDTARYYTADGFKGNVGFISPVSDKFCDKCNRIRLLSDGRVRPCLGHDETFDLMPFINDREKLVEEIKKAVYNKPKGHEFSCGYGNQHAMNKIGG